MLNPVAEVIAEKFSALEPVLDERVRPLWGAILGFESDSGGPRSH